MRKKHTIKPAFILVVSSVLLLAAATPNGGGSETTNSAVHFNADRSILFGMTDGNIVIDRFGGKPPFNPAADACLIDWQTCSQE
jgi:hypothetical protein